MSYLFVIQPFREINQTEMVNISIRNSSILNNLVEI